MGVKAGHRLLVGGKRERERLDAAAWDDATPLVK